MTSGDWMLFQERDKNWSDQLNEVNNVFCSRSRLNTVQISSIGTTLNR